MATRRRIRLGLRVDDRTEHLTEEALYCRRYGHRWVLKSMTKRRFNELLAQGLTEDDRFCEHIVPGPNGDRRLHCGGTWRQVWELRTGHVIENDRGYPKGGEYLLPKGSGRLARDDARVAHFARQYAEYV